MKNTLNIDFANSRIVMDRTFAKKCEDTRSEEYAHLQRVRQDYPTFDVHIRTIKKNTHQEHYHGLTYGYMRNYLKGKEENAEELLKKFDELILISECHSKGHRYPTIKKWFLAQCPEIKAFYSAAATADTAISFQKEAENKEAA